MQNPVLRGYFIQILMLTALWWFLGYWVLLAFVIQASIAIFLLEYVNYIQHYGPERNWPETFLLAFLGIEKCMVKMDST